MSRLARVLRTGRRFGFLIARGHSRLRRYTGALHLVEWAAALPALRRRSVDAWLDGLMEPVRTRPALVAHSLACGPALRFAVDHPDRVSELVLVSPAFLQAPPPRLTRSALAVALLRRVSAARLARFLGVPAGPAAESAAADLRRRGVARRVVAAMRTGAAARDRSRALLDRVTVPVRIVVGSADPLTAATVHPVTELAGAGHYPQLTHPAEVARHLSGAAPAGEHP
ncbi:alpha/beta fold hydrolase [Streptomyces sp. NPDC048462]|uniref:alpha/beta fold hydrolase n=1 Tax=Streptomyces sp. NPDC048462 TaxID=3365555 RepID=UPI0037220397